MLTETARKADIREGAGRCRDALSQVRCKRWVGGRPITDREAILSEINFISLKSLFKINFTPLSLISLWGSCGVVFALQVVIYRGMGRRLHLG